MTEGISKERLKQILHSEANSRNKELKFYLGWLITTECKELDPWLPIDDAPRDTKVLVRFDDGECEVARLVDLDGESCWVSNDNLDFDYDYWFNEPTHYKLLPDDPK